MSTFGLIRSKIFLFRIFTGTDNKCQSCRSSFVSQSLERRACRIIAVVCGSASNAFASIKLGPGDFPLFNIFMSSIISFIDGMEQTIATWCAAGRMSVIVSGAGLFNRSVKWSINLCLKFVLLVYLRCCYFLSFTCFSDFDNTPDSCLVILFFFHIFLFGWCFCSVCQVYLIAPLIIFYTSFYLSTFCFIIGLKLLSLILSLHLTTVTAHEYLAFPLFSQVFFKKSIGVFSANSFLTHCFNHISFIWGATFNCILSSVCWSCKIWYLFYNKSLKLSTVLSSFYFSASYFILLLFCIHFLV